MNHINYNLSGQEPRWAEWQQLRFYRVPVDIEGWLRDTGSLTARLKSACKESFRVRLLRQGWGRPLYSEQRLLGMNMGEIAIVREVELICDGTPWVFARTLIPARSLRGPARRLSMLGEKPLGEVLFADLRMTRGTTEMARLSRRHKLYAVATESLEQKTDEIWGRRTLFHLAGHPLLVNEIFLPDITGNS